MVDESDIDLGTTLRDLAVRVAEEAAVVLAGALDAPREVATKSTPTDMVTEMDGRSEALVVARLRAARPDDGLLGEEGTDLAGSSGVRWVIDPLDGTTNYLYRRPAWAVSIAAERDGVVLAGAVVDPSHGDTWAAARGAGATRNGRPLRIPAPAPLPELLLATGFSYDPDRRARQARRLVHVLPRIRDVRRMGSAAIDVCSVAAGLSDAYLEEGVAWWDIAAAGLVAEEAGARIGTLDGTPFAFGKAFLTAHPDRWDELVALFRSADEAG